MSGRYVPPHRRLTATPIESVSSDQSFQKEMFSALRRTITGLVNKVSRSNVHAVGIELFRENIVRGRGLLCGALIATQQADPDMTPVFAALVAIINKEFPSIGKLLLQRLVSLWKKLYRRRNWPGVGNVNVFIGQLFCQRVVDEDLVIEVLLAHLLNPNRSEEDVDLALVVFDQTFRALLERSPREFRTNLLDPLREMLLIEDPNHQLSRRSQAVVEATLKKVQEWEKVRLKAASVPSDLALVHPKDQVTHHLELDEEYSEEGHTNEFSFDEKFDEHEAQYETARSAILGPNWEDELLTAAEEVEEMVAEPADTQPVSTIDHIVNQEDERKAKERVYLIIRSSLRADEMAHKILKSLAPRGERVVCTMVIDACCQESTYRKVYALLAERLCKSSSAMQHATVDVISSKYSSAESLSERQIEHIGLFWAHLLRTESIRWNCLSMLRILTSEASQRLIIQALLRALQKSMGALAMRQRLMEDKELEIHIRGLLPQDGNDIPTLQLVVDLYEAMGIEVLATIMRTVFEEKQTAARKRQRND